MKHRSIFILFIYLIGFHQLFASKIIVGKGEKYSSLQAGIHAAKNGDSLIVKSGIYLENELNVNKKIILFAEPGAVIDGNHAAKNIFLIQSDSVNISGFELKNVGASFLAEVAAIRVRNSKQISISNNKITNCFFSIYLENASYTTVSGNQINGFSEDEAKAGNGIHAWKGHHLTIKNNRITQHRDGIYFEFIDDSEISGNNSHSNLRYGLHFMFSNRDSYKKNTFKDNGAGVAVMFSRQIIMIQNNFIHNWGGASYGLLLKEISDGSISENNFYQNTIGILAEGANRLKIEKNQFTLNGTAINMKGNCLDNEVLQNNFLANTFEVVTNSKYSNNLFAKNYWSTYSGYDLNRDGYGDVPFRPVNLFAKITHEIPAATIMLHSFFITMIEIGEKMFPEMIPAELVDNAPKFKPYQYDRN